MSTPRPSNTAAATPFSMLRGGLQLLPHGVALLALMCGAFTTAASTAVIVLLPLTGIEENSEFYVRLAIKAMAFAAVAGFAGWYLRRLMRMFPPRLSQPPPAPVEQGALPLLAGVLISFVFLLLPNLATYPWTAPDELHHLSVVRNLVEYDRYASGHPAGGFVDFDSYDSVGPAVLVPSAATYSLLGRLEGARLAMPVMFLLWIAATWLLLRPVVGGRAASVGVLLAGTAIGSLYLGRTLYGEVPALMYATAGLLYWRLALGRIAYRPWSVLAGVCFGLSVLSKSFLLLAVFPVAAVWVYDRLSFKRIPISRLVWPGIAAVATIVCWSVYQNVAHDPDAGGRATLHLYRHYLLFGLTSVDVTLSWFAAHWTSMLLLMLGFVSILPILLLVRYDPPTLTLALTAILFAYWWIFFTPGQIPRYLWYTLAVGGALAGPLVLTALECVPSGAHAGRIRFAAGSIALLLLVPSAIELRRVGTKMLYENQMTDEYALRDYMIANPERPLVTTSWMAQRSANFFANRHLDRIAPEEIGRATGYVVRDGALEEFDASSGTPLGTGRYVLVNAEDEPPVP